MHLHRQVDEWHRSVGGSFYEATDTEAAAMGWSMVAVAQINQPTTCATFIADIFAQPISPLDMETHHSTTPGNDIAEACAVHNALLWHYTHAHHLTPCHIHYDSKAAGCVAEGLYNANPDIKP